MRAYQRRFLSNLTNLIMRHGDSASAAHRPSGEGVSRTISIVLLFSLGAIFESTRLLSLRDAEIWGHLQVGDWILKNKCWPQFGLFSQATNLPWRDFNWGYDALAAVAYQLLGLRALPALLMGFRVALAGITFLLAGGRRGNVWSAVALSAVAQYALFGIGPDAAFASAVLFGTELLLLLESRRSGNYRLLFALPLLFLLWANLDLGFVYGMGLYALFFAALAVEKTAHITNWNWVERPATEIQLRTAALAGCACLVASAVTPYAYHGYAAFFAYESSAVNRYLPGYTAMSFHQPQDYVLLLLVMAAFFWLGVRRSRDVFLLGVLIGCVALAFHAQRENWLATLAAVAVIGESILQRGKNMVVEGGLHWSMRTLATAGITITLILLAFALRVPRERGVLMEKIAESFPVRACDFIRHQQLAAPLFNSYEWGGFLTWYLPEYPVAIDGQRGLFPEEEELDYFKVMNAEVPYQSYPPMNLARTLLLNKQNVMGEALRGLPGFQVMYEDHISIVLLQKENQ